jgi:hypothetical protein
MSTVIAGAEGDVETAACPTEAGEWLLVREPKLSEQPNPKKKKKKKKDF